MPIASISGGLIGRLMHLVKYRKSIRQRLMLLNRLLVTLSKLEMSFKCFAACLYSLALSGEVLIGRYSLTVMLSMGIGDNIRGVDQELAVMVHPSLISFIVIV